MAEDGLDIQEFESGESNNGRLQMVLSTAQLLCANHLSEQRYQICASNIINFPQRVPDTRVLSNVAKAKMVYDGMMEQQ